MQYLLLMSFCSCHWSPYGQHPISLCLFHWNVRLHGSLFSSVMYLEVFFYFLVRLFQLYSHLYQENNRVIFFLKPFEALTQNGLMVHNDSNPVFWLGFKVSHIMHGTKTPTYYHTFHYCIFCIVSSNGTNILFNLFHKSNVSLLFTPSIASYMTCPKYSPKIVSCNGCLYWYLTALPIDRKSVV